MAIVNISGTINSSFGTSGVVVNAAQAAGDAVFTIDLRPTNPIIIVQDNLNYGVLGWDINDVVAVITVIGPQGQIYVNEDYGAPDIVPATSRYLNKTITLPLDPLTNYANILKGNYTLKISWYNSNLDEYYNFLDVYQYNLDPPTIANTTTSGPYTGVLTSTDTTEYGNDVHQIIREHRVQYPTQLNPIPPDVVSSNAEIQVTPIYTNQWTILINSFVEYRMADTLRVYWEGDGEFNHCVYGGCIGAMYDAIETMLTNYREAMACNLNNQEAYQKRLVIVNTAWHLLNEAYWSGDAEEADEQAYIIQEQVAYTGDGICEGVSSELVTPCPPWTGGGVGGTYTFSNALVEAAGNVTWGGSLVQATTVLMTGYEVLFSGADAGNTVSQSISTAGGVVHKSGDGSTEAEVSLALDTVTFGVTDIGTPANTRTYEVTVGGLVEVSDYSATYTGLNLVNKNYVDALFAAASSYTFENGITEAAGNVVLGGELTEETNLILDNYGLNIQGVGASTAAMSNFTTGSISLAVFNTNALTPTEGFGRLSIEENGVYVFYHSGDPTNYFKQILVDGNYMLIIDEVDGKGFENQADYSANWTDHSLVTKKWVEDNFAAGTLITEFTGLSDTPNDYTGFASYFVQVNPEETGLQFVSGAWVPVTGGTFTGQVTIATSTDRPLIIQQIGAGSTPGVPEGGINLIAFQDNDGDEQGYVGIDGAGNLALHSNVTGGSVLINDNLYVNGGISLDTGPIVNEIEIDLTNDDTHIPTSGAVYDAIAAIPSPNIIRETLIDNAVTYIIVGATTEDRSIHLMYTIERNISYQEGLIRLLYDGTNVFILDDFQDNEISTGISFTADINGENIRLIATATSTGYDAIFKAQLENITYDSTPTTFQYIVYDTVTYAVAPETLYQHGIHYVRRRIVGNAYYIDITINGLGFDGTEYVDWINLIKINGQDSDFRSGERDGDFVVDCEITATGFAGTEDIDWENLNTNGGGGALTIYRDGIRDHAYVIDKVLTATGFAGVEDVDWENLLESKIP